MLRTKKKKVSDLETLLPAKVRRTIGQKQLRFFTLDATKVAQESGMGKLTNNIMQTAFFKVRTQRPAQKNTRHHYSF